MQSVSRVPAVGEPGGVELSEKKLAKLIDAIEAAAAGESGGRRLAARLPAQGKALLAPVGPASAGPSRQVRVYDISRFGIAVIDAAPMPSGAQFRLLVPRAGRRPLEMFCTVRHTRPIGEGHIIGAQYGASWLSTVASVVNPAATGHVAS